MRNRFVYRIQPESTKSKIVAIIFMPKDIAQTNFKEWLYAFQQYF